MKIYNHSLFPRAEYAQHSPWKHKDMIVNGGLHSLRALPLTTPDDAIQLDSRLKDSYPYMRDHFDSVGLSTTDQVVWDTSPQAIQAYSDHELDFYLYGPEVFALRPDAARLEATQAFNNKNTFITYCKERGYPIPLTLTSDCATPDNLKNFPLPAYVKAAVSSAGVGIYRVESEATLHAGIGLMGGEFQIQAEIVEPRSFLNVQYKKVGNTAIHFATTEQIMNGVSHAGNRYPTAFNPRDITDPLANELVSHGLGGIFAFDVAVASDEETLIECNARWNGASYPATVAERLEISEWTACELSTSLENPQDFKLNGLAYESTRKYGAVILSTAFMAQNRKVGVMLAGPADVQKELRIRLAEALRSPTADELWALET